MLAVTLQDFQDAGISSRATNTLLQSQYASVIVEDGTLATVLEEIADTKTAPLTATKITSVAGLSQITAGSPTSPNIYLIEGDLTITSNIEVPSNVQIYVDGSIYKAGTHTRSSGPSENEFDYIFRVRNAQNVKLIGIDNALLHSRQTLNDQLGHATAVYVTGNQTNNVTVEGFEIGYVWEGLVSRGGPKNVTFSDNYIHDTLKRAIWHLTSQDSVSVHNFVENAGADGMDWDAFVDRSMGYENVVVGAGRWLGFVEEAAEDSAFIRNFGYMVDYGNPNADLYYQLGWVDHGTTAGVAAGGNVTQNNYFIDNVVFRPSGFNEGGQYYANLPPKGDTWFWANRGYKNGSTTMDPNYFGDLIEAEWLTFIPDRQLNFQPTVANPGESITPTEWLSRLDTLYNAEPGIELVASPMSVSELAAPGTAVGLVVPLDADLSSLTFEITAGNSAGAFAINDNGVLTVTGPLDRDTQPAYSLTVAATDGVRTGSLLVGVGVRAPLGADTTLFDHEFDSPDFSAGDVRNQQGWTAQNGWEVVDPGGAGETISSTTAYQGITNVSRADVGVGDLARVEIDLRIDVGTGGASDLFRFGVTTLDSGGSFVPALKNNGSSTLTGRVRYNGASANVLTIWPDETTVASQVELTEAQLGLDFGAGDRLTDELRITWEAEKSATPGVWDVGMVITNLDTGAELGRNTIPITEATVYNTSDGLYAGIRGLQNSSTSTFRLDRFAYGVATPGAPLPGDFNDDGTVDAADYTVYRDQSPAADSDGSGVVDSVDLTTWRANYGQSLPAASDALSAPRSAVTAHSLSLNTVPGAASEPIRTARPTFQAATRSSSFRPAAPTDRGVVAAPHPTDAALLIYLQATSQTHTPAERDDALPDTVRDQHASGAAFASIDESLSL